MRHGQFLTDATGTPTRVVTEPLSSVVTTLDPSIQDCRGGEMDLAKTLKAPLLHSHLISKLHSNDFKRAGMLNERTEDL